MAGSIRSARFVYFMMSLYLFGGVFNTIFLKLQNQINALTVDFQHPWFQLQTLFIGEIYCLIIYFIMRKCKPRFNTSKEYDNEGKLKERPAKYKFIIPTILDFCGQICQMFALGMIPASVFAMFKGGTILSTALLSKILFKRLFHRHHYLGMFLIVVGIVLVGFSSLSSDKETDGNVVLGYAFTFFYLLLTSFQMISEEAIVLKYKSHSIELAGWQGAWGFLFGGVILIIFQFIPCNDGFPLRPDICSIDDDGDYLMENTIFALKQMFSDVALFFYIIGYTCSTSIQNMFGISVTKFGTATSRAVVDNLRPIIVWIFFLLVKDGKGQRETFSWLQLVGFLLMIIGIVIYNEILELPFWGLNLKLKAKMKINEMQKEDREYVNYQDNLIKTEINEIENLNKDPVFDGMNKDKNNNNNATIIDINNNNETDNVLDINNNINNINKNLLDNKGETFYSESQVQDDTIKK